MPSYLDQIDPDIREELVDTVAKLLARRATPAEIGRAIRKQFEVPSGEQIACLAAGLGRLVEWVGVPREDPRFDSLALCESVVRSNAMVRERMAAQARIDKLLQREPSDGDHSPPTPPPSVNVTVNLADLSDDDLDRRIRALEGRTGAAGPSQGEAAPLIIDQRATPLPVRSVQEPTGEDQPRP